MHARPSRRGLVTVFAGFIVLVLAEPSRAQATGDFNGDGFADLAIGVPSKDSNDFTDAGAVQVIYGSASRLSPTAALPDQVWHQDKADIPGECDPDELFGSALAVGDFNDDGNDDLAIGSPGEDVGGDNNAGTVTVIYGSIDGLDAAGSQLWHQDIAGVLDGAEHNDEFGASLTTGDFDGDGVDDLAVGVPGETVDAHPGAGGVAIFYGSGVGLTAAGDQFFTEETADVPDVPEIDDRFGSVLASGDFNGDGIDELAIGTPNKKVGGADNAGCVHVLFGTSGGLTAVDSQFWSQNSPGVADTAEDDDNFGQSLAAGDFDDDGRDDLAIGVPDEDVGSFEDGGAVHVLYGRDTGLRGGGSQFWTQDSPNVPDPVENDDNFGHALAAGDFNDDGFADIAIGSPGESVGSIAEAGSVIVLHGSGDRLTATASQKWHQDSESILDKSEAEDHFGATLCTGDFDADGRSDLAVGVPDENIGAVDAGAVHVFYGSADGLRAGPDQLWHQNSPDVNEEAKADDEFGSGNAT